MALSVAFKAALAERPQPDETRLRARMQTFMAAHGLTDRDLGMLTGYSRVAISHFRLGRYGHVSANQSALMDAIDAAISDDKEDLDDEPTGKLYTHTLDYKFLRQAFYSALNNGFAYHVHGNPGTQKSYIGRALKNEVEAAEANLNGKARRVIWVEPLDQIAPLEFLKQIAAGCGLFPSGSKTQLVLKIRYALAGRRSLLVLDEAQRLSPACLEAIRPLLDHKPYVGMLFMGSHNLNLTFERFDLAQWHDRIRKGKELPGLSEEESQVILRAEMPWLNAAERKDLIERSRRDDLGALLLMSRGRRRRPLPAADEIPTYINARRLFGAIQVSQQRRAARSERADARD
ncbi:MAG: ATP-binding protein [Acidobacteriia bacterium]|nr:ATP-binding protein [Terriglobia bacterium]